MEIITGIYILTVKDHIRRGYKSTMLCEHVFKIVVTLILFNTSDWILGRG